MRTAPISSAIPARALASTDRVTGSSLPLLITLLQYERSDAVYRAPPAGPDDAGGLFELDDRRARHLRALTHLLTIQDRHLPPLAVEVCLPTPRLCLHGPRRLLLGFRFLDRHGGYEAQADQLHRLVVHPVSVA